MADFIPWKTPVIVADNGVCSYAGDRDAARMTCLVALGFFMSRRLWWLLEAEGEEL